MPIELPPLRDRREDILPLSLHFIRKYAEENGREISENLKPEVLSLLEGYNYPGNVRELENILERALALCDGSTIFEQDLHLQPSTDTHSTTNGATIIDATNSNKLTMPLHDYLDRIERDQIMKALETTENNRTQAARVLGITFRSLRYRLTRLGID